MSLAGHDLVPLMTWSSTFRRTRGYFSFSAAVFTRNGAITLEKEDETGTIESGKSADFIVINQNILEVPVEKIHQTKVLKTVLRGHTVYEAR